MWKVQRHKLLKGNLTIVGGPETQNYIFFFFYMFFIDFLLIYKNNRIKKKVTALYFQYFYNSHCITYLFPLPPLPPPPPSFCSIPPLIFLYTSCFLIYEVTSSHYSDLFPFPSFYRWGIPSFPATASTFFQIP